MSENPACYGHYSRNSYRDRNNALHYTEDCKQCSLARWCKNAADKTQQTNAYNGGEEEPATFDHNEETYKNDRFKEFLFSLSFIDSRDFMIIQQKMRSPMKPLHSIARSLGVTKTAIDKRMDKICRTYPVWESILRNVPKHGGRRRSKRDSNPISTIIAITERIRNGDN